MSITIDKGILYDTFCNTFDDNNRSVSSGFGRFRGKGLPIALRHAKIQGLAAELQRKMQPVNYHMLFLSATVHAKCLYR